MDLPRVVADAVPGLRVSASVPDRVSYARDLWPRRLIETRAGRVERKPACVVWPRTVESVVRLVNFARQEGIPIVPYGAGSGVCGAIYPDDRTIVVDVKEMAGFSIDRDAPLLDVGAGAIGITLEEDVARQGFTIGHFPSSILCSTVGGWIAARGAGQCSGLYGKIEDMVESVECVLGTGELVTLRRRFDGPNMLPLMIGSEGTLGVITRARLRLHTAPESRAFLAFSFPDITSGWEAMRTVFQAGLRPAVARLYDPIDSALMRQGTVKATMSGGTEASHGPSQTERLMGVMKRALKLPRLLNFAIQAAEGNLLPSATLVFVYEGNADEAEEDAARTTALCTKAGATALGEGPARRWYAHRYGVSYRQSPVFRAGAFSDTMEVAAPWSRLQALYDAVREALGSHVLVMAHLSHAYPDGCSIYFTFSGVGKDDEDALAKYDRAWRAALDAAIAAGGTLSHHHGVGRSKAPKLGAELGYGVEVVGRLMRAWDPAGILNPGALVSRDARVGAIDVPSTVKAQIDTHSMTATLPGDMPLDVAEELVQKSGLTLGLAQQPQANTLVGEFVSQGLPGTRDPWSDPVDQALSGLSARLKNGRSLVIRSAPRRAVGPDLTALFTGAQGALGTVEGATLGLFKTESAAARVLPFAWERNPPLSGDEKHAWDRVVVEVTSA
ncbi:MAG TPA: FAD-linked oxidase C-terminal domain-containing protein [Polyangiaceae bacterium]|nr:FAD-linked oxidase C-terminal domain-containing protein [Polyangiaceae bacterium]